MYFLRSQPYAWPRIMAITALAFLSNIIPLQSKAQCGFAPGLGCANTDYTNFGINSTTPATIEYDNYVTGHNQTVARTGSGIFKVWGQNVANDGTSSVLSPQDINLANYPMLTGTVLKATIGSNGAGKHQLIVLTTTGLFAGGTVGTVLSEDVTNTSTFTKLTINNITTGLPLGVKPADVKMLFATANTLVITTCAGQVWILSQISAMRGNNSSGNPRAWYPVATNASGSERLTGVVAVRGSAVSLIALRNDNTLWTWGINTYLGDGSPAARREVATQMALPAAGTVKMIGGSTDNRFPSYYVLYTDGRLFAVGDNTKRQLGDWTTTERRSWVQPRYSSPSGPTMGDIKWISPREHDWSEPAIGVINSGMRLYTWGYEEVHSLGQGNVAAKAENPKMPAGLTTADEIVSVELGGESSIVTRKCTDNFGYVGHRTHGSMADGTGTDDYIVAMDFNTAPLAVCGASSIPQIGAIGLSTAGRACKDSTVYLDPLPAGGTLSVISGPGSISGNALTFSNTGTVVVQYVVTTDCGNRTITRSFDIDECVVYRASGKVWQDLSEDGVQDAGEPGVNAASGPNKLAWANLVASDGRVMHSVPVKPDGTYNLQIMVAGTYSVQLTGEEIAIGSLIPAALRPLPGAWKYVSRNDGTPCALPSCTNPDIITGVALNSGSMAVSNLNFGIKEPPLMPVELSAFTARASNHTTLLNWTTHMENNNAGFEIYRSIDSRQWQKIGFIPSLAPGGNSDQTLRYHFTDFDPADGINYYRLKQVSANEHGVYSDVVSVQFNNVSGAYLLAPNPTRGMVKVKGLTGRETIRVIDYSGRQVMRLQVQNTTESIDLSAFAPGVYQIVITTVRGSSKTLQVLKKD